jgi:hypothetical protein
MGQLDQSKNCPQCGKAMMLALPVGGKGLRTLQCIDCERPDPITSPQTMGWLAGELGRAKTPDAK